MRNIMSEENTWWEKVEALSPGESFITIQGTKYTNFGKNPATRDIDPTQDNEGILYASIDIIELDNGDIYTVKNPVLPINPLIKYD
tara:strand:+ start:41426 stop:41683 length:258 start_codon:yes stop_codon:yes gene_type:complete